MQRTLIVHWNGGENMNPCFQLLFSLLVKSLGLWDYKIEIEKIFSLVGILTNLKRCRLKIDNLDNLIFIKKIWPNDPTVDCYLPFNLINLIDTKTNVYLEKKLEEYEGEFEQDELIMDM